MEEFEEESLRSRSRSPVRRSLSRSISPARNKNGRQRQSAGGRRVIVRNIPYDVKWQDLKDMFRKGVGDVTYVEMLETPEGKSKGVAVVEFRDPQDAEKAVEEFHQKKIKDRAIIVREEREKDRQEFAQNKSMRERGRMGPGVGSLMGGGGGMGLMGGGGGMGLLGGGGMGLMGGGGMGLMGGGGMSLGPVGLPTGVSPQILQQLGIDGPITSTVFVANLDYSVTWWKLKDVFKLAGNVITAEVKEDKNGQSRGMGVVVFEHPMEAVQAVSMFNGQKLYERNMIVRVDKVAEQEKPKLPSGLKSIGMGLGSGGAPLTNIGQLGSNVGLGGGSGLMGMGNLGGGGGGNSGLGLLGAGSDAFGMGGLGGSFGGMGFGNSGSLNSGGHGGSSGGMGMGGSVSDLGMGGLGGSSKMGGMSDSFSNNYPGLGGSNYNGNSLSGLGNIGPNLNSLSAGLGGMGGNSDRFGMGDSLGIGRDRMGLDRMGSFGDRMGGLSDRMGGLNDRMGGLGDRMGGLGDRMGGLSDRMVDRMMGLGDMMGGLDRISDKLRDNYGNNDGRDMRDDGNRRMTRPGNSTLVVKNLPWSVTWQALKEHFRDAGDVKFAEIVVDKGKSTGVGYVRFGNESDAQRAITLKNKSRMEHRNIDVSLHRN